ncbi:hypothetical protein BE15_12635 [Sorangium cellulosum]|uniref:Uncharacterized protein n=2 Tax=Sorangium cellulosum TaxID=56 RepID=A0A150QG12_SORCE|nr:hypothetical protein BE15_12635 [Sorangium cellulosum]
MTGDAPLLTMAQLADLLGYRGRQRGRRALRLCEAASGQRGTPLRFRNGRRWFVSRESIQSLLSSEFSLADRVEDMERAVRDLRMRIEHLEAAGPL